MPSGITIGCGLGVVFQQPAKGLPSTADNLCLFLGSSDNLTYCFGDEREIPERSREEAVGKYGNTILTVLAVSSGSFMVLYFNS